MLATLLVLVSLAVGAEDVDGDGYDAVVDCDDTDAAVHPDAPESCDGVDNNCVDGVDEDAAIDAVPWYVDADGDGYPGGELRVSCDPPGMSEWVIEKAFDCDDTNMHVGPCPERGCDSAAGTGSARAGTLLGLFGLLVVSRRRPATGGR